VSIQVKDCLNVSAWFVAQVSQVGIQPGQQSGDFIRLGHGLSDSFHIVFFGNDPGRKKENSNRKPSPTEEV